MKNVYKYKKKILNICGLRCPESIMVIRNTINNMNKGQILFVISDDISTKIDIPSFCIFMKNSLIKKNTKTLPYSFLLQKGILKK